MNPEPDEFPDAEHERVFAKLDAALAQARADGQNPPAVAQLFDNGGPLPRGWMPVQFPRLADLEVDSVPTGHKGARPSFVEFDEGLQASLDRRDRLIGWATFGVLFGAALAGFALARRGARS